ncbi:MAG: S8 family serine peptidase [Nitrosomonas sp.]|nr:S8 family serine peptidase [Nitrosomonas sp.]
MNTKAIQLTVQVLDSQHHPINDADIVIHTREKQLTLSCRNAKGFYATEKPLKPGRYTIEVSKKGFEPERRPIKLYHDEQHEVFFLLKKDTPYYYRGKVKVPFIPDENHVALYITRQLDKKSGEKRTLQSLEKYRIETLRAVTKEFGLQLDKDKDGLLKSGVAVCSFDTNIDKARRQEILAKIHQQNKAAALPIIRQTDKGVALLTNEIMVRFEEDVEQKSIEAIAQKFKLKIKRKIKALGNLYHLTTDALPTYDLLNVINQLSALDEVDFAEPNLASTEEEDAITPTDYLFPEQWDHQIINTQDAWQFLRNISINRTFGHPDIIVGVVDSGVDPNHPDLNGTVSSGNAKIYQAFDFEDMVPNNNTLTSGHGTSCASAAASRANNPSGIAGINEGIAGVAGNCRVLAIRRAGTEADYANIYLWAGGFDPDSDNDDFPDPIDPGADVISSSIGLSSAIGSPTSGTMAAVFDKLTDDGRDGKGVLLFFSAGNNGNDNDTAFDRPWGMYNRCFSIAASTLNNTGTNEIQAGYSNFSSQTEFCAPSHDAYVGGAPLHNPPANYGAFTATPTGGPEGHGTVGRPTTTTTLSAAANAGANQISVNSVAGMANGQAIMIGNPGGANTESHLISAINNATTQITLSRNLFNNQANGTAVNVSNWDYRSNFGGTSHSTPLCAGTAALMLSANPQLTWTQVRDLLRETAIKINPGETNAAGRWQDINGNFSNNPAYDGNPFFSEFYGYGRIDTASAVREAGWDIELLTSSLNFNDVPAGDTVSRAVRFNVKSLWPANFTMTTPGAPFAALSTAESLPASSDSSIPREVYFWVTYTGTTPGDQITLANGFSVTVINPETEQTWLIPITANVIERPSAAVMLCLDQSASMDWPSGIGSSKRIDILRFSANIMVDVLHEGNGLGIVAFDHNPHDVLGFIGPVGAPVSPSNPFDQDRTDMKSAINNFMPNPAGNTAIGDGIERAWLRLNPVTGYDSKSVIVFTDGKETASKYVHEVTDLINGRMFAIGLGKAENIEPATLNEVTNANDGYMLLADNLGEDSIFKLAKYFLQIQAGVNNEDIVVDPDGVLYPGQKTRIPFMINEADISVDVITMSAHPASLEFYLETPNGQIVQPGDTITLPGATYGLGTHVAFYRLNVPLPLGAPEHAGKWHAILAFNGKYNRKHAEVTHGHNTAASAANLPYSVLVHTYSNLKMQTRLSQSGYEPDAKLALNVALTQYGIPLTTQSHVSATVLLPNKQTKILHLTAADEGVYETSLIADVAGTYQFRIRAEGYTLKGRPFTREKVHSAFVYRGGNRLPPTSGDGASDTREKFCSLLKCLLDDKNLSREFKDRLRKQGIDIDGIVRCLQGYCSDKSSRLTTAGTLEQLKTHYTELIKAYQSLDDE